MKVHRLRPDQFERLAGAGGTVADIRALRAAQVSRHLLLIGRVLRDWPGPLARRDAIAAALQRANDRSPAAFQDVIGAPLVGAWSAIVNRALNHHSALPADLGHLDALAMVACAAAGCSGEADIPVRDGMVALPGLGVLAVAGTGSAHISTDSGRLAVHAGGVTYLVPTDATEQDPSWHPVRHLAAESAGHRITLALDDVDPYRHGHHAPPTPRLTEHEVDRWRSLLHGAWRLLAERLPDRAHELAAGLQVLVPLVDRDGSALSATIRHVFGAFGLTRPSSPTDLATTLVHEFQHSKLSALRHLMPLSDPTHERRYWAPWRVDPRPLSGLLQGVYAFVAVADAWRAFQDADGGVSSAATARFAETRLQCDRALAFVESSGALTPAGEVVAARLRRVVDAMLAETVPSAVARAAAESLQQSWRRWLTHNPSVARRTDT